jgi:hypothetical protein
MSLEINRAALLGCWLHIFRYETFIQTLLISRFAMRSLAANVSEATIIVAG